MVCKVEVVPQRMATVKQIPQMPQYSWATESGLRHLLFRAENNGLSDSGAIIKLGRRVLIDLDCFDAWLASHRQK